jgi:hypothetical protein
MAGANGLVPGNPLQHLYEACTTKETGCTEGNYPDSVALQMTFNSI